MVPFMIKISPSILSSNFSRLSQEVEKIESIGIDMLHIDVMDGHFVPNISFGAVVFKDIRPFFKGCFDVHLMISNPLNYLDSFAAAGADLITIHVECDSDIETTLKKIKSLGLKSGLSIKPNTPACALTPYMNLVDLILVMTVEPGFGGQKFMADKMDKLLEVRHMIDNSGREIELEVDGGINEVTAKTCVEHGATVLVAGSYIFSKPDYQQAVDALLESCNAL